MATFVNAAVNVEIVLSAVSIAYSKIVYVFTCVRIFVQTGGIKDALAV